MKNGFRFIGIISLIGMLFSCDKISPPLNNNESNKIATSSNNVGDPVKSLTIGGSGWIVDSCNIVSNTITSYHYNLITKFIAGGGAINTGTCLTTPNLPLAGQASIIITNMPGYPNGVDWHSMGGMAVVSISTLNTVVTFTNLPFSAYGTLPSSTVYVSGTIACQ